MNAATPRHVVWLSPRGDAGGFASPHFDLLYVSTVAEATATAQKHAATLVALVSEWHLNARATGGDAAEAWRKAGVLAPVVFVTDTPSSVDLEQLRRASPFGFASLPGDRAQLEWTLLRAQAEAGAAR